MEKHRDITGLGDEALARIRIVLCQTSHPGNIGATARAMKTMGFSRLYLVSPRRFPDPQAEARAAGAVDVLVSATICTSLDQALAGSVLAVGLSARPRELVGAIKNIREAASEAVSHARDSEVALVFGNESSGLSNDELGRCQLLAMIPANPLYSSLNLAMAVQIACYELRIAFGESRVAAPRIFALADQQAISQCYRHAESTLIAMHFLDPERPRRLLPRLRRLFSRTRLEREEVNILRGILASIDELIRRVAS